MRVAISRKLSDQKGASMLLALLFLLICVTAAASILVAAAANAGKNRSNLAEHQTYLALSSAVSTLCDELNRSEYRGQYRYWETQYPIENDDGTITTITEYHFEQLDGAYTHTGSESQGYFREILLKNLDALLAWEIENRLGGSGFKTLILKPTGVPSEHTLTLTPDTGTELDTGTMTIQMKVQSTYAIYVTAWLNDVAVYKIEAELTPDASAPTLPASLEQGTFLTAPMKWRLGWITVAEAEDGATS